MKKLMKAINETQQIQQEFGLVVAKLEDNMDIIKEGFAIMTLAMAQMKTSIENLQEVIGTETDADAEDLQIEKGKYLTLFDTHQLFGFFHR